MDISSENLENVSKSSILSRRLLYEPTVTHPENQCVYCNAVFCVQTGEGLNTVLESMESSLGAPTPEQLARLSVRQKCDLQKKADDVKEPLPTDEPDDCDSAEDAVSEGELQ